MLVVKFILKVMTLPVLLILTLVRLLGTMAMNVSGMAVSLFMLVIFLYGVFQVFHGDWLCVAILAVVEAVCFIFEFVTIGLMTFVEGASDKMIEFIHG